MRKKKVHDVKFFGGERKGGGEERRDWEGGEEISNEREVLDV